MPCSSCGGRISPQTIQKGAVGARKPVAKKVQPIAPIDTRKIAQSGPAPLKTKIKVKSKQSCPICGAGVRTMMAGTGPKKRFICTSCGNQFTKQ